MGLGGDAHDVGVNACGNCVGTQLDRFFSILMLNPITLVLNCNKNVNELETKLRTLDAKRQSVEQKVNEGRGNAEGFEVENWKYRTDVYFTEEAKQEWHQSKEEAKKRCFMELCLNPVARYKLSKKAKEDARHVDELLQGPNQFLGFTRYRSAANSGEGGVEEN